MKRKIRIAHLINDIGPAGKEKSLLKLLAHMDRSVFENTVIVLHRIYKPDLIDPALFQLIHLDHAGGNDFRLPFKLAGILREQKIDLLHTRSWGTLAEGFLGAKLGGVPLIVHSEHGTFPEKWLHRWVQRCFWSLNNRTLAVSGELKERMSKLTGISPQRIKVILNGVEDQRFYPSADLRREFRRRHGFSDDDFIVGTVGRLFDVKNHPMLIRATAAVVREGHEIKTAIVGGGPREVELRKLAGELKITGNIHFVDFVSDVNMHINGFDVFTLTSFSEGCSNVIQEAMFCEKPIVATDVGGNGELVHHRETGLLVESDNHEQLAQALIELKEAPQLRQRLARAAREYAMKHFTVANMAREYQRVYLEEFRKWSAEPVAEVEALLDKCSQSVHNA